MAPPDHNTKYPLELFQAFPIDLEHLRHAINGAKYSLNLAFRWEVSPQGWEYWHRKSDNRAPLTDEDKEWLRGLLAIAMLTKG